jgi:hypothetical protein
MPSRRRLVVKAKRGLSGEGVLPHGMRQPSRASNALLQPILVLQSLGPTGDFGHGRVNIALI